MNARGKLYSICNASILSALNLTLATVYSNSFNPALSNLYIFLFLLVALSSLTLSRTDNYSDTVSFQADLLAFVECEGCFF